MRNLSIASVIFNVMTLSFTGYKAGASNLSTTTMEIGFRV
jgi:hypothetical protein